MRLATWNVNSVAARLPRLLEWLGRPEPDVLCLQETKTAELPDRPSCRRSGTRRPRTASGRWNGVAVLSRVGHRRTWPAASPGNPGFPDPEARAISATCGGLRVWSVYVPNGRDARRRALHLQAGLAGRPALGVGDRAGGPLRPGGDRRLQHRPDRRRRLGSGRVRPELDPRHPGRAGRAGRTARPRAGRRRADPDEGAESVHVLGLPGRHVPPGQGHAHRPGLRHAAGGRPGRPGRTSTGRRARARARPTTPRSCSTCADARGRSTTDRPRAVAC